MGLAMLRIFSLVITFLFLMLLELSSQETKLPQSESINRGGKVGVLGVPQDILDVCSKFFNSLIEKDYDKAFGDLLKYSPLEKKKDELEKLINETKRANLLYGQISSYEPVSSDIVSELFIRIRYLAYHNDFPIRWIFTFYKSPKSGWIVVNLRFDDLSEFFFKED